ncbi:MAG: hypothetical protein MUE42_09005 [Opitutaceae bacterium]|nr:hypothetical protein [Opitutaceae bacterium]
MHHRTSLRTALLPAALLAFAPAASATVSYAADFLAPAFTGETATDGWYDLNSANFPGYGTFGTTASAWPAPIGSNQAGSGDAVWDKLAGTSGYLTSAASNVLYSPNSFGTFTVSDVTPVSGLANVLFQVSSTGNLGVSAATLSYNGGSQSIVADLALLFQSGPVTTAFGPATQYVWAYQWDLSDVVGPIGDFAITWTTAEVHNLTFGARLDQSTVFAAAIPEPSAFAVFAGLAALALSATRRRKRIQ